MTRKYPLDPLRRVREENVDHKVRALSDSLRRVESARDELECAERRKRDLESRVAETTATEGERLSRGELTAADLARGAAWALGTEMERAEKARLVEQARALQGAAEMRAAERQRELGDAKAAAEVVTKHHQSWQRARAAESMARDEEDAEEAYLGLHARRGVR